MVANLRDGRKNPPDLPCVAPSHTRRAGLGNGDDTRKDTGTLPRRTLRVPRKHLGDSESTQQQLHPSLRSESRRRAWRSSWWGRPAQRPGHPCRRWSPLRVEARLGGAAGSRSSLEGLDPWTEIPPLEAMLRPQVPGAPPTRSSDTLGLWPPSHLCGRGSLHSCPPASSFTPSSGPCHPRWDLTRRDEAPLLLEAIRGGHSDFTPRAGAQGSRDRKRASLSGTEGSAASPR